MGDSRPGAYRSSIGFQPRSGGKNAPRAPALSEHQTFAAPEGATEAFRKARERNDDNAET